MQDIYIRLEYLIKSITLNRNTWNDLTMIKQMINIHIYQPLHSGRIWHRVNF